MPIGALRGLAHLVKQRRVLALSAVREIEAEDLDTGGDQGIEHLR